METIRFKTHVSSDGILKIEIPVNMRDVECEGVIVYTTQPESAQDDWVDFVHAAYGSLADDPIERGVEPPLEVREPIE